jgi:hypothetical protein
MGKFLAIITNKPSLQALEKAGPKIRREVDEAAADLAAATTRLAELDLSVGMGNERDATERNRAEAACGQANRRLERARSAVAQWERELVAARSAEAEKVHRQKLAHFADIAARKLKIAARGETLLGEVAKFCRDTLDVDQEMRQSGIELIGRDLVGHPLAPDRSGGRMHEYLSGRLLESIGSRGAIGNFFHAELPILRDAASSYVVLEKAVIDRYTAALPASPPAPPVPAESATPATAAAAATK